MTDEPKPAEVWHERELLDHGHACASLEVLRQNGWRVVISEDTAGWRVWACHNTRDASGKVTTKTVERTKIAFSDAANGVMEAALQPNTVRFATDLLCTVKEVLGDD